MDESARYDQSNTGVSNNAEQAVTGGSAKNDRPRFVTEVVEDNSNNYPNSPFAGSSANPNTSNKSQNPIKNPAQSNQNDQNQAPAVATGHPKNKRNYFSPKNLLFLIPAGILVATIVVAAYISRDDYIVRETPQVISEPTQFPMPTTEPVTDTKVSYLTYSNDNYTFQYPDTFQLAECGESVNLYISTEDMGDVCQSGEFVITLSKTNQIPNYQEDEELVSTESATIAGNEFLKYEFKANGSNVVYLPFSIDDVDYQFVLRDIMYRTEFLDLLDSFQILLDVTSDWSTYEDNLGYSIKYPETWTLIENEELNQPNTGRSRVEIRRIADNSKFQNLTIEVQQDNQAAITASEAASSTRRLVGWDEPPVVELRDLGGANAQIIKGSYEDVWNVYVIVWFRNVIIQMTWEDTAEKSYDQFLEQMLNSLEIS